MVEETPEELRARIERTKRPRPPEQPSQPTTQLPREGPITVPTELQNESRQVQLRYKNIVQAYQRGKITEQQAEKLISVMIPPKREEIAQAKRQAQEIQRRFESYDEIGKIAFFMKNPEYIETLKTQEQKDQIRAAIAGGQDLTNELISKDPRATTEAGAGIFISGGGSDYRVLVEYRNLYLDALKRGDQAAAARYYEYMVSRAARLKLYQQGGRLGSYILSQPLVQYAIAYGIAKGLIKAPAAVRYPVTGALAAHEAPHAIKAAQRGRLAEYARRAIPAVAGGVVAGAAARTPRQITHLYTPPKVKGPTVGQKAYSASKIKFPTVSKALSPVIQKIKSYKPVKSYLHRRTKIRAGYRPSLDIPLKSRTVQQTQQGITKKYIKTEIFKGRGKRGLISPAEMKKYKPGVTTEPSMSLTYQTRKYPSGKIRQEARYFKLLERKEITPPKQFLFWKKIRKRYGYARKEESLIQTYEPPRLPGKVKVDAKVLPAEETTTIQPTKPSAWEGIKVEAATPYLKKTRFGRVKEIIPTESQYQAQLKSVLSGYAGKPKKLRFSLKRRTLDTKATQTLVPETELIMKRPSKGFGKRTLQYRGEVYKLPLETTGEIAGRYSKYFSKYISAYTQQPVVIESPSQLERTLPTEIQQREPVKATEVLQKQKTKQTEQYSYIQPQQTYKTSKYTVGIPKVKSSLTTVILTIPSTKKTKLKEKPRRHQSYSVETYEKGRWTKRASRLPLQQAKGYGAKFVDQTTTTKFRLIGSAFSPHHQPQYTAYWPSLAHKYKKKGNIYTEKHQYREDFDIPTQQYVKKQKSKARKGTSRQKPYNSNIKSYTPHKVGIKPFKIGGI